MDRFLIILSGACLVGLVLYWAWFWRGLWREHRRVEALRRVANEKVAVRALAHQDQVGHAAGAYMAVEQSAACTGPLHPEERKAMAAMDWGADDSLWEPGMTAVDALIKQRDDLLHEVSMLKSIRKSLEQQLREEGLDA